MGKQIRFYMLPKDEFDFLQYVYNKPNVVAMRPVYDKLEESVIGECSSIQNYPSERIILYWNKSFTIKPEHVMRLPRKKYSEEIADFLETGEEYYKVDTFNAPVIEHSRSFIRSDGKLTKGRIWAEMRSIENEAYVYKGKEFEAWCDQIAHWIRRNFTRVNNLDAYVGTEALEWLDKGGIPIR